MAARECNRRNQDYPRQRRPPTAAPACLLTPKPAALAVIFPALLQSFLTGANTIPDPWSPFSGRHVESATTFQTRLARVIFQ